MMVYPPIRPSLRAASPSNTSMSDGSPVPSSRPRKPRKSGIGRKSEKQHKRSRSGCFTCRLRRKKCDEGKPSCGACNNLKLDCEYTRPIWWGSQAERNGRRSDIKDCIKVTKIKEKNDATAARSQSRALTPPSLSHSVPTPDPFADCPPRTRESSTEPKFVPVEGDSHEVYNDPFDPYQSQLGTPGFDSTEFWTYGTPYEVDVKTERQLFVNDVPTRTFSSVETYTTYRPPRAPYTTLPTFSGDDWVSQDVFDCHDEGFAMPETYPFIPFEFQPPPFYAPSVDLDECDRPLFDHFLGHVVPVTFPVFEARQPGTFLSSVVLPAFGSSKAYRHSCLLAAATHKNITQGEGGQDLQKHRQQGLLEVCDGLKITTDESSEMLLEATLAMIFFGNAVDSPTGSMFTFPWHMHRGLAKDLAGSLDLPNRPTMAGQSNSHLPPFSMTLFAWLDILGSTMLGQMPVYAQIYRKKLTEREGCGLQETMGCDDRVMYLISEIAYLDNLKMGQGLEHSDLCACVQSIGESLKLIEPPSESLRKLPPPTSGDAYSRQLVLNITALFHVAARIYLCSLVPEEPRRQADLLLKLTTYAAEILDLIPAGPEGFDRSIVWPLLICGAFSTPQGNFRQVLQTRIKLQGDQAAVGNFGRLVQVLQEVWRIADSDAPAPMGAPSMTSASQHQSLGMATFLPTPDASTTTSPEAISLMPSQEQHQQCRTVHWRAVMKQNGWDYLLI